MFKAWIVGIIIHTLLQPNKENIKSTTQWSNDTRHLECCYKIYVMFQQNIYQIYGDAKSWSCSLGCCCCFFLHSFTTPRHATLLHSHSSSVSIRFSLFSSHIFVWCFSPLVSECNFFFLSHFKLWIFICFLWKWIYTNKIECGNISWLWK